MKLFSHNAGQFLHEKAKSLSAQHNSWRCIYLNFAENKDRYSEGVRTMVVTNIIKELLEHDYGYIYLCDDGDVLILFQGQALPVLNKIGEHFEALGHESGRVEPGDLYTIFDLSKHWPIFLTLCKSKAPAEAPRHAMPQPPSVAVPKPLTPPDRHAFELACAMRGERKKPLVLLVEDDPFTRRLAGSVLKGAYDVVEAGDAADALQAYGRHAPDAVFLDIELPDASGHVVLGKLLDFDSNAFVVMLSGHSIKENILAALEKGAQGFVTKPFAKEKLLHYLHQRESKIRQGARV